MLGLKRGTVELVEHQACWHKIAGQTVSCLKQLLGQTAVDVQHVGSTAILSICAKPIIDIALAVRELEDIKPYIALLEQHGIHYRREDVAEQLLFVIGEGNHRTHHIHVVKWLGGAWNDYLNFRDYLNTFPEKAKSYQTLKQKLAAQFPEDRGSYTSGKQELISCLLDEARLWRESMGYTIEPMITPEDMDGKGYVHYTSWQETYTGLVDQEYLDRRSVEKCRENARQRPENTLVAKVAGKVAGFVCYHPCADEDLVGVGEVGAIYLLKEYQGCGIGYALMNAAVERLFEFQRIAVWVLKGNDRAIRFYERYGFRFDGAEKELVMGTPRSVLRMVYCR